MGANHAVMVDEQAALFVHATRDAFDLGPVGQTQAHYLAVMCTVS